VRGLTKTTSFLGALSLLLTAAILTWAQPSEAALRCEEIDRYCENANPYPVTINGYQRHIPAPILNGYNTACWHWKKRFQCIETDPIYSCESGRSVDDVKNTCNLVDARVLETAKINTIQYITSAEYDYRCNWGEWETEERLPEGKECVVLDQTITDVNSVPGAGLGVHPNPGATLNEGVVVDQDRHQEYVCYSSPVQTCSDTCYEEVLNPDTGIPERQEVPCTSPVTNCIMANDQCRGDVDGQFEVGPDGRCILSDQAYMCQNGPIPRCLTDEKCVLDSTSPSGVLDNGIAMTEEQNYLCSNTTTSCVETSEVSNCVNVSAWGWDQLHHPSSIGTGLGEFNQAMAKLDAIEKGMNENDPYIFSGINLRCRYAVGNFLNTAIIAGMLLIAAVATGGAALGALGSVAGLTGGEVAAIMIAGSALNDGINSPALGANCCKNQVIEGKEAWYRLGSCTADEVKLSIAKQKGLSYYLGEYCSKKGGFPVRQCVQKTKSYCVFDDMLSFVVNKEGRKQLDELALADPLSTSATPEMAFKLYAPQVASTEPTQEAPHAYSGVLNNGSWQMLLNEGGSQVWYWQYPGYCRSPDLQAQAYDLHNQEINMTIDTTGSRDGEIDQEDAIRRIRNIVGIKPFQTCSETQGLVHFLTCEDANNDCDPARLPEDPDGILSDEYGENVNDTDVRWRSQQVKGNYLPGQYGVTMQMESNPAFAAVSNSLSALVTSVGSCQGEDCLFRFIVTDRASNEGLGARKRVKDYIRFPLYTIQQSTTFPVVDYVRPDGSMPAGAWENDPNKMLGDSVELMKHRFIPRPNYLTTAPKDNIHTHVLLEWSPGGGEDSWTPILLPTSLAPATEGFYPYGDPNDPSKQFYISGGCDVNSRWCLYEVQTDLVVPRHPWGSAKEPRCWGFSIEQVAALDFDRMDLSEWLNSLDLGAASEGLSESAAKAFTDKVLETGQNFYSAYKEGDKTPSQLPGSKAIVTNTDTLPLLSSEEYKSYTLKLGVTANWPQYYERSADNNNPVTNVRVDWGDGSAPVTPFMDPGGRAYFAEHDYTYEAHGTYKITVTLDTQNHGSKTLTTTVEITPNAGEQREKRELDFDNPGSVGSLPGDYIPSEAIDGTIGDEQGAENLSPGSKKQYEAQGEWLTGPQQAN